MFYRAHGTSEPPSNEDPDQLGPPEAPGDEVVGEKPAAPPGTVDERDMVEMWNHDAPAGPEWGGPRNGEPTKFGDWATKGRVSDF